MTLSEIKYLDKIVLVEGCTYHIAGHEEKVFKSLKEALEYCRKMPIEKVLKTYGNRIPINIYNPNIPEKIDKKQIPQGLLVRNCKDTLCVLAKERTITVASDLSEVYTEFFSLSDNENWSDNIFDYGLLYGNYPVYTGKELCVSNITNDHCNISDNCSLFVPIPTRDIIHPDAVYDYRRNLEIAYQCLFVVVFEDGSVEDGSDGFFPYSAVPVSTFRNIGKAGVTFDFWDKLFGDVSDWGHKFVVYGVGINYCWMLSQAILNCKMCELPNGREYYIIIIEDVHQKADGLMPADAAGLSLRDSQEKLWPHAKKRYICIAPLFDAIYWEYFELRGEDGQIFHFCFDHELLKQTAVKIEAGNTYQTSYWNNVGLGNPLKDTRITVCSVQDPDEIYEGHGDIMLCCKCKFECGPDDVFMIPVSTLTECKGHGCNDTH